MEPQGPIMRDGFRVIKSDFTVPQELSLSDPQLKRKTTICNLFVNHQLGISDITRLLDESHGRAIEVLIEQGILEERRRVPIPVKLSSESGEGDQPRSEATLG